MLCSRPHWGCQTWPQNRSVRPRLPLVVAHQRDSKCSVRSKCLARSGQCGHLLLAPHPSACLPVAAARRGAMATLAASSAAVPRIAFLRSLSASSTVACRPLGAQGATSRRRLPGSPPSPPPPRLRAAPSLDSPHPTAHRTQHLGGSDYYNAPTRVQVRRVAGPRRAANRKGTLQKFSLARRRCNLVFFRFVCTLQPLCASFLRPARATRYSGESSTSQSPIALIAAS